MLAGRKVKVNPGTVTELAKEQLIRSLSIDKPKLICAIFRFSYLGMLLASTQAQIRLIVHNYVFAFPEFPPTPILNYFWAVNKNV
jgi:hypothetical protein